MNQCPNLKVRAMNKDKERFAFEFIIAGFVGMISENRQFL